MRWLILWLICLFVYRIVMQDIGDLSVGVLCQICWSLHVLCVTLQHMHEDFLHCFHSLHYLSHEIQSSLLHHLWCDWRQVPTLPSTNSNCTRAHLHHQHWLDSMAIRLEFLFVAWISGICPPDCDAAQDESCWEFDQSLCRMSRTLPLLLHHQLVSIFSKHKTPLQTWLPFRVSHLYSPPIYVNLVSLPQGVPLPSWRLLLLDTSNGRNPPNRTLPRLPVLLLQECERRQASQVWTPSVR